MSALIISFPAPTKGGWKKAPVRVRPTRSAEAENKRGRRRIIHTDESDTRLREMWNADEMIRDIADALGMSPGTVIKQREALGLPARGRGYRRPKAALSADRHEAMIREIIAADDGLTIYELRCRLGERDVDVSVLPLVHFLGQIGIPLRTVRSAAISH